MSSTPSVEEWRDRACRAENRLRSIEPERDEYKASWLDAVERERSLEAQLAALEQEREQYRDLVKKASGFAMACAVQDYIDDALESVDDYEQQGDKANADAARANAADVRAFADALGRIVAAALSTSPDKEERKLKSNCPFCGAREGGWHKESCRLTSDNSDQPNREET